jgi:hypothetical protein
MPESLPILFLSGMATDERLFEPQIAAFPSSKVVPWVEPLAGESLVGYAARLAPMVDPGVPCVIGGASFGGAVSLEMAPYLQTRACILIGSLKPPSGIPLKWRLCRPFASLGPNALRLFAWVVSRFGRRILSAGTIRRCSRLASPEFSFVRWAMCVILQWRPSEATHQVPVFQIHGSADDVLPCKRSGADEIVPGGPHALTLFRSAQVNAFIEKSIRQVT